MTKITQQEINKLITGHLLGNLSKKEQAELSEWCNESPDNIAFFQTVCNSYKFQANYEKYKEIDYNKAFRDFQLRTNKQVSFFKYIQPLLKYAAVALLLVSIGAGIYFLKSRPVNNFLTSEEIAPGKSKAILLLEDGSKIALESDTLQKIQSGETLLAVNSATGLTYDAKNSTLSGKYNTLVVPRGGEYRITLADGTKVHLNSASELRYPVSFGKSHSRDVYLKGEGYFEVAKRKTQAFIVHVGDINVKQYGTAFNINAYSSDQIQVTLVHGSIGVRTDTNSEEKMLQVSQLAEYSNKNKSFVIKNVDLQSYVAWNDGLFVFEDESLENIMNTLSLWYDVDFSFSADTLKNLRFTGSISRDIPVNNILDAIASTTDVKMSLNNRNIQIYR